jgi:ABC-type antimicrobial peptide transport system permease subunit
MWLQVPDPNRQAEVRVALAKPPFRFAQVAARSDLVAEEAGDPLTQAIVWAQVVAALAGLTLSIGALVMGAITDLRDERGELADLEAQGVPPSSLRWHALARSAWLAIGGSIAGLIAGLALAIVVTGALAIDAEGRLPIPPLVVVLPPLQIAAVVGGVLVIVLGSVAVLAARTYGRATLGERRGGRTARRTAALATDSERVDG